VRAEGRCLLGLLRGDALSLRVRIPEVFLTAGEFAAEARACARALRVSPAADLGEAVLRMEMADADAVLVESSGRPPGVLELERARTVLSGI
jgi:hypothetical protein